MKKVFKGILSFLRENLSFLVFLIVLYAIFNIQLPFVIYAPGGAINLSDRVEGDNTYKQDGSISMTYVSMIKGSLPYLGLSFIIPDWDVEKTVNVTYDNETLNDTVAIDKIYLNEAYSNAQYVAYTKAGIPFDETNTRNIVTSVYKNAKTKLKYGDEIENIDGNKYNGLKEFQDYVATKKIGDHIKITYKRDKKTYEDDVTLIDMEGTPKVGIGIATISDYSTKYNIKIKSRASESGPSGGFMTTLQIYNEITPDDITKGRTIMGTGTISKDGTVGEIGGVKYKLIGAVNNGADIFICPDANLKEALEVKKNHKYNIKVIGVKTFDEAIEKLSK